jgi:ABC-type branched-subunit amino acid transport system substrate-binding protein
VRTSAVADFDGSRLAPVLRAVVIILAAIACVASVGCGGDDEGGRPLYIYVNAPFSGAPYIGETMARGVELGARLVNGPGLNVDGKSYVLRVKRVDNRLSPQSAVANVRRAVGDGSAVAIIDEGTGVDASWRVAADANLPVCITYQGGIGLVDPDQRPNVFRIAPTDHGLAFRLAEYILPKGLKIALLVDDSTYGQEGEKALEIAFRGQKSVVAKIDLPASATDVAPQVLRARRAGANALLVWAQPSVISAVITAARSAGWDAPLYTPPAGADPLIRQELSDHADWLDGVTFASGRMTAEAGTTPFFTFVRSFEEAYGPQEIGVQTADGEEVVQPPDYAMYSFDFVRLLAAAMQRAGAVRGKAVVEALNHVTIAGANGDERGFNFLNHEGVIDDDVYFARFQGMTFAPVRDDLLSASLPAIDQTR